MSLSIFASSEALDAVDHTVQFLGEVVVTALLVAVLQRHADAAAATARVAP